LSGYKEDGDTYVYFDPIERNYVQIKYIGFQPPSPSFNETFTVVSFYKPLFMESHQNLRTYNLPLFLIVTTVFFLIGAVPLYLMLRLLANAFAASNGIAETISHRLIYSNFTQLLGQKGFVLAAVLVGVLLVTATAGTVVAGNISHRHETAFSRDSAEYRKRIIRNVSPGEKITGRIFRREYDPEKVYTSSHKNSQKIRDSSSHYEPAYTYTIEFLKLLDIPVYVNMKLHGDADTNPQIRRLDRFFENTEVLRTMYGSHSPDTHPIIKQDIEFLVNSDYSVSLAD
jgi:predicted small integral membrane protein